MSSRPAALIAFLALVLPLACSRPPTPAPERVERPVSMTADGVRLGTLQLLPGWSHQPGGGFDSTVGDLVRSDGFRIDYEIGKFAGIRARHGQRADGDWYRTLRFRGDRLEMGGSRKRRWFCLTWWEGSASWVNYEASVSSERDLAEMLLMALSRDPAWKEPERR
jgi:hypothetical protein